jgi:hypothetical protein
MRGLLQQLEEMHMRVAETASHEEALVKALAEALARLDEQLLADVQTIASEHEVRRTAILGELQGLASSIGMFQVPRAAVTARQDIEVEATHYIPSAGDWREAMNNLREDIVSEEPAPPAALQRAPFPHERRAQPSAPLSLAERRRRMAAG